MDSKVQIEHTNSGETSIDLPPKTEEDLYVELVDSQMELYKKVASEKSSSDDKMAYLAKFQLLRNACDHVLLLEGSTGSRSGDPEKDLIQNSGKMIILDKLLGELEKEKHQVLIFSQVAQMLNILEEYCQFRQYKYCRIDGTTKPSVRQQQIKEFTAPGSDKFIFIISTKAAGLGINLNTADRVIIYDTEYAKFGNDYAVQMACRSGQKNPVHVYKMIAKNTMEEKIYEIGSINDGKFHYAFDDEQLNKLRDVIEFNSNTV